VATFLEGAHGVHFLLEMLLGLPPLPNRSHGRAAPPHAPLRPGLLSVAAPPGPSLKDLKLGRAPCTKLAPSFRPGVPRAVLALGDDQIQYCYIFVRCYLCGLVPAVSLPLPSQTGEL